MIQLQLFVGNVVYFETKGDGIKKGLKSFLIKFVLAALSVQLKP